MSSSYCRRMVSLCLSDACSSRASRLPRRATSLFSRVTSLRSSPRSARRDSIVVFWFSARSRVARSRRVSLSAFVIGPRLVGSTLASESRFSRRVTSACRERAFFAVRRTSFVSSTAAFSLLRHRSSCHFSEPARPRASAGAFGRAQVRLWNQRLAEGHHDIGTATLSMGIAFRHQYLAKGEPACRTLIEKVPDPIKRERRRDVIYNGTDAREFRLAVNMWISLLNDMDEALSRHDWLAGDGYTITDAAYTPYLTRLDHLRVLGFISDKPRLAGWYERIKARTSYTLGITDWLDADYLSLMAEKGKEAWPKVEAMIRDTDR